MYALHIRQNHIYVALTHHGNCHSRWSARQPSPQQRSLTLRINPRPRPANGGKTHPRSASRTLTTQEVHLSLARVIPLDLIPAALNITLVDHRTHLYTILLPHHTNIPHHSPAQHERGLWRLRRLYSSAKALRLRETPRMRQT